MAFCLVLLTLTRWRNPHTKGRVWSHHIKRPIDLRSSLSDLSCTWLAILHLQFTSCNVSCVLAVVDRDCCLCCFVVRQCNKFNGGLSTLSSPVRDLDLLTKNLTQDDILVNVTSSVSNNDVVVDEFSSFMFWRQPLPSVDLDDLAVILTSKRPSTSGSDDEDADGGLTADFDEFNYWRVPIPQLDVADLLRCLHQL